jgi:diguanylate cyclase (GGDEF)-like protein
MLQAATIDELTNILNRRTFILRSKEIISMFERRMEPVSFLLLDIDVLKKINDEYGHSVGDIILRCFADTIRKLLRNYDLFGRYGGEEFSVLLPGTNESESAEIAERLRNAVEDSCLIDYPEIKYTVSIGAATVTPDNETTVDMLFKLSDNALYLAKLQGKNRVVWLQK